MTASCRQGIVAPPGRIILRMITMFALVESREEFEHAIAMSSAAVLRNREIILAVNSALNCPTSGGSAGVSRVITVPFSEGLPLLAQQELERAAGDRIGFCAGIGWPLALDALPPGTAASDWIVTDWWACLGNKIPYRREPSRRSQQAYGRFEFNTAQAWEAHLEQSGDPAWLLGNQPVSWFRKQWLLDGAPESARLTPTQWSIAVCAATSRPGGRCGSSIYQSPAQA